MARIRIIAPAQAPHHKSNLEIEFGRTHATLFVEEPPLMSAFHSPSRFPKQTPAPDTAPQPTATRAEDRPNNY